MVSKWGSIAASTRLLPMLLMSSTWLAVGEANGAQLTASWVDNSNGVATSRLERRLGTGAAFAPISDVPPGVTQYVDAAVSMGVTYCYRVQAVQGVMVSDYSAESCATPASDPVTLSVVRMGAGSGSVASTPSGISCGSACSASYPGGTSVSLTAVPASGSTFAGWSACAGTAACPLTLTAPTSVQATFTVASAPPPSSSPPPPSSPIGLRAAYAFSEGIGRTTADISGNRNVGALTNGSPWTTQGKFGNALAFNGVSDFVSVPDSASLDLGATGTIEAWVNLAAVNRWHGVITKLDASLGGSAGAQSNYALEISNINQAVCTLGNGAASIEVRSTATLAAGQFRHLACTWNGTTLTVYIDGVPNASVSQTLTPVANASPLYIGQFGGVDLLSGVVDEVRVYSRALSQAEIQSDMNTPIANAANTTASSLRAAYAFSEGLGLTTADASGNANIGTLTNGPGWTTQGKFGNALSFDGVNDFVTIPASPSLDLGSMGTISAWVKLSTLNRWHGVLAKLAGNAGGSAGKLSNYAIEISQINRAVCSLGNGLQYVEARSSITLVAGRFYHLACTWNGTALTLYVDGVANVAASQNFTPAPNTAPLYIGQYGGVDLLNGVVDEVRVYSRALSQAEIQSDMTSPTSTVTSSVLDVVPLDNRSRAVNQNARTSCGGMCWSASLSERDQRHPDGHARFVDLRSEDGRRLFWIIDLDRNAGRREGGDPEFRRS